MAISQARSKRKQTGALYKAYRKKKKHELGRLPALTRLDEKRAVNIRTMGGNRKVRVLSINIANLLDPKTKKHEQVKIKTILESPANRHFVRRNIMTKGCIVEAEKGKAKITSRPGQDGTVNAVLIG